MTKEEQINAIRQQLLQLYMQKEETETQIKALRNLLVGLEYTESEQSSPKAE